MSKVSSTKEKMMGKADKNVVDTKSETSIKTVADAPAVNDVDTKDETANPSVDSDTSSDTDPAVQNEKSSDDVPPDQAAIVEAIDAVENVLVTVPKAFKLLQQNGIIRQFSAGVQTVDKEISEHWYAKANGMKIFNPEA